MRTIGLLGGMSWESILLDSVDFADIERLQVAGDRAAAGARLATHGLDVLVPDEADRALVHRIIDDELVHGVVTEASRAACRGVIVHLAAIALPFSAPEPVIWRTNTAACRSAACGRRSSTRTRGRSRSSRASSPRVPS